MGTHDLPVEDLRLVVRLGLERAGDLLTAGERLVADRILALEGPAARVYARLSQRKPEAFQLSELDIPGVEDVEHPAATLEELGLADRLVPPRVRAEQLTIPRLRVACVDLGLRRTGRKAALVERLASHRGFAPGPWLRIRHRGLIRRLERWAFLRRHRDRSTLVVERLGHVRWPEYALTRGPGVHHDRRALLRWEALLASDLTVEQALHALERGDGRAGGRLDLTRRLARDLAEHARGLERVDAEAAVALYEQLTRIGHPGDPIRHARALEKAGASPRALELLRDALEEEEGPRRLAIHRAGRRLARSLRRGWAPDRPLARPTRRLVRLPPAESPGPRPLYAVEGARPVEQAVVARLGQLDRRALHVENGLWTTLFALCFAPLYFHPVPGALPGRWLSGPLDLGRPRFYDARRPHADALLDALRAGEGPDRIAEAHRQWSGTRLAGARWELALPDLVAVAEGLGGRALAATLEVLLQRGWRAARGLPDLVILPGDPVKLPDAVPERLGPGLLLAEIKGPGDSVRDAQALWFHRLRSAGAPIALWEVRPLAGPC